MSTSPETKMTKTEDAISTAGSSSSSSADSSEISKSELGSTGSDTSSSDESSSCDCQSCENIREEKRAVKSMHFEHASTMSEFYPGKVGGGLFERGHVDSRRSSNIYDNVDSISRFQMADDYHTLGHYGPSHLLRNCFPIWSLSTPSNDCSPSSMTRILVDNRSNSPTNDRLKKCGPSPESFVAAIGVVGLVLGVIGLSAYLIIQVPEFRATIGPNYATVESRSEESIYNPSTLIYSVELVAIVLTTIIGILVNALLVHGVRKGSCYFLLPWLAYHVLFIAGLFVAIILIVCFALPFIYRLFALIPAFASVLFIFAWSKVYDVYLRFRIELRLSQESNLVQDESWYASAEQPSPSWM